MREKLVGYLFSGWYTERRYVDPIDRYRDVILVDNVEAVVLKQVKYAIRKCRKIFEKNSFLGLSYGNIMLIWNNTPAIILSSQWRTNARCLLTSVEAWRSLIPLVTTGSRSSRSISSATWDWYSNWVRSWFIPKVMRTLQCFRSCQTVCWGG